MTLLKLDGSVDAWEHCGFRIYVLLDELGMDFEDSIGADDSSFRFLTFEGHSALKNKHEFSDPQEALEWAEEHDYWVFNLYKYEHSQVCYNTHGFSCPWDSGQVGYFLVSRREWLSQADAHQFAESICDCVTAWCNGWQYGYVIKDEEGDVLDSCFGFLGGLDDSGLRSAANSSAEYLAQERDEKLARELEESRRDMYLQELY